MERVILRELERNGVPHVHTIAARATAGVEIERLALLMAVKDLVQLTVAEHNASAHETVRTVAGHLFKALQ